MRSRQDASRRSGDAAQTVTEPEPDLADGALRRRDALDEGQQLREGAGQVRGGAGHEQVPFDRTLPRDGNIAGCQVAQAAVHELRAPAARAEREVVGLGADDGQAAARGIQSDAGTGHPAADDEQIDLVAAGHPIPFADPARRVQHRRGADTGVHGRRYPSIARVSSVCHSASPIRAETALCESTADCTMSSIMTDMSSASPGLSEVVDIARASLGGCEERLARNRLPHGCRRLRMRHVQGLIEHDRELADPPLAVHPVDDEVAARRIRELRGRLRQLHGDEDAFEDAAAPTSARTASPIRRPTPRRRGGAAAVSVTRSV